MKKIIKHSLYFNNPYASAECGFLKISFETKEEALAVKDAVVQAVKGFIQANHKSEIFKILRDENSFFKLYEENFWKKEEHERQIYALGSYLREKFNFEGEVVYDHSLILSYLEEVETIHLASDFL